MIHIFLSKKYLFTYNILFVGCTTWIYLLQHWVSASSPVQAGAETSTGQLYIYGYGGCNVLGSRVWGK